MSDSEKIRQIIDNNIYSVEPGKGVEAAIKLIVKLLDEERRKAFEQARECNGYGIALLGEIDFTYDAFEDYLTEINQSK